MIFAPYFLFRFFRRKFYQFRKRSFSRRFGDATEMLTQRNENSAVYFLTFCYKRLLIDAIIVFSTRGYFQVVGTMMVV